MKKIVGYIKLEIPAGKANPSPPVGPALGQKGLNIMEFCKAFNAQSQSFDAGTRLRVLITAYADRSFSFILRGSPTSDLLKRAAKLDKGSNAAGRTSAGSITMDQVKLVAEEKMKQGMNAVDIDAAMKVVIGSARSMGLKVVGGEGA